MTPRIGVFPASGGLGSSIVNHLSKLTLASQLTLIARNPSKWDFLGKTGATLRHADYDQPTTLDHAFDNIDILMLISYASIEIEHRTKVWQPKTTRMNPLIQTNRSTNKQSTPPYTPE